MMPAIEPHNISIVVNGKALIEYDPPVDEVDDSNNGEKGKVVYVEAAEGIKFEVQVRVPGNLYFDTDFMGIHVYLDGDRVHGRAISKRDYYRSQTWRYYGFTTSVKSCASLENNVWVQRDFQFSNLRTTDATVGLNTLKDIARNAGTISVRIFNAVPTQDARPTESMFQPKSVPEKALKGQPIDLVAGLADARPCSAPVTTSRNIGKALLTCHFKYRSKKALQMLDLIPMTPEPVPLDERPLETLNLVEARELLARMRKQGNNVGMVKQEDVKVKMESAIPSRKRTASATVNEVNQDSDDDDVIFVETKRARTTPPSEVEVLDLSDD